MSVIIKCKMCGGDLALTEGSTIAECEYCGTVQTVPTMDDDKKFVQFERAERLRKNCEFDKAAGVYESIVADFRQEAEAYWGLVLCKYGIEYVDDPATGKKVPTCHRSSFESIMEDPNFEQALENADVAARKVYREEAKQIEEIRKGIIEVSSKEDPYDIFICYKETAEDGQRTIDSVLAQDLYDELTDKGYRVFFSRITLEDKLGQEYEPYIFAALNSAKVMLAFGTDYEYFNAVWVKNEWSRYLKLMEKDKTKHLIPCFKGIDAYDMPKEFNKLQAQDLGKIGATQDLLRGIDKLIIKEKPAVQPTAQVQTEDLNRSFIYNSALEKAEENKIPAVKQAIEKLQTISGYGDTDQQIARLQAKLKKLKTKRLVIFGVIVAAIAAVIIFIASSVAAEERARKQSYYDKGVAAMEEGNYSQAINYFNNADGYEDSEQLSADCQQWLDEAVQFIDQLQNPGIFIADDGEMLNLWNWNDTVYYIGAGAQLGDGVIMEAPMATEPVMPEGEGMEIPEKKYFDYDGMFSYDGRNKSLQFTELNGNVYTITLADGALTFNGSGQLSGRVYHNYGVYYINMAQELLNKGMNYSAAALTRGARNEFMPESYFAQAEQIELQAMDNMQAQETAVQKLFSYRGSMDDETMYNMEMLMVEATVGNLSGWPDVLRSGKYTGDSFESACGAWADSILREYMYCAPELLLQIAGDSKQLGQAVDYMASYAGSLDEMAVRIQAGDFF